MFEETPRGNEFVGTLGDLKRQLDEQADDARPVFTSKDGTRYIITGIQFRTDKSVVVFGYKVQ